MDEDRDDESEHSYRPAADQFVSHSRAHSLSANAMAGQVSADELASGAVGELVAPTFLAYSTPPNEVAKYADTVLEQLQNVVGDTDDVTQAVADLLGIFLVHPAVAHKLNIHSMIVQHANTGLERGETQMAATMFNYQIPNLLRGVRRSDSTGLVEYDIYGRPRFDNPVVVPNTPHTTTKNAGGQRNLIVRGIPNEFQSLPRAEDVFVRDLTTVPRGKFRVQMPTNTIGLHRNFMAELKRTVALSLAADDEQDYVVFLRFDVGSDLGRSGLDAFAPHLVFNVSASDGGKRPAEMRYDPLKAPRRADPADPANSADLADPANSADPNSRKRTRTDALNGHSSIVSRLWQDTITSSEDNPSIESVDGVQDDSGNLKQNVLFGDKARPGKLRFAEPMIEHYRNSQPGSIKLLHLSTTSSNTEFDFGDVDVPMAMQSQMSDGDQKSFHELLREDVAELTGVATDDTSRPFGFTSVRDYLVDAPSWWHALAYISMTPISNFTTGKSRLNEEIDTLYQSISQKAKIFLATRDVFAKTTAATFLTPSEAMEMAGDYPPETYALPATRIKGKVSDEIAQFAVRRPIWRMPDSWVKELLTIDNINEIETAADAWYLQHPTILASLCKQIKEYSARLEEEYVKARRTLKSASYLRLCNEYMQRDIAIVGHGTMLGEVLPMLLVREAEMVLAYPSRATACANALCEAIQLFAVVEGLHTTTTDNEVGTEAWYDQVATRICSVQEEGSIGGNVDTDTLKRMNMQIRKTPNEEVETWKWLRDFVGKMQTHMKSVGLKDLKSYAQLDSELKKQVSAIERIKGRTERQRMVEYLGTDLFAKLIADFDPVLFISLCHCELVLQEIPRPNIKTDEYEDRAYIPVYTLRNAGVEVQAVADAAADTLVGVGDILSTLMQTYIVTWTSALSDATPEALRDSVGKMGERAKIAKPTMTIRAYINSVFNTKSTASKGSKFWPHFLYQLIFGDELKGDFEPESANDETLWRLAFVLSMRLAFISTIPDPGLKETAYNKQIENVFKHSASAAYSVAKALVDRDVAHEGYSRHVLEFFASTKPTRDDKFQGGGYKLYLKPRPTQVGPLVNQKMGIATKQAAVDLFLSLSNFDGNASKGIKALDVIADLFGTMERVASSAPGTLAALFFGNLQLDLRNKPGAKLLLGYYAMRWDSSDPAKHPSTSIAPYEQNLQFDAADFDAPPADAEVPPPRPVATGLRIARTRAALLSIHNLMGEVAENAASGSAVHKCDDYNNALPEHRKLNDDDQHKVRTSDDASSTLLYRANARRLQIEMSRVNLNGNRAFNWAAPDLEHLKYVLNDTDPWGSATDFWMGDTSTRSKRIFTLGQASRKINESLVPESARFPFNINAVDKQSHSLENIDALRRDLNRWSWIMEFEAHDASYFERANTLEQAMALLKPMHPSRRVVADSGGSHSSLSILAKTSASTSYESVSIPKINRRESVMSKFDVEQLLSIKGANTVSDRLFLSNGYLDAKALQSAYIRTCKEYGNKTWLSDKYHSAIAQSEPSNEQTLAIRMSTRGLARFAHLKNAHAALSNIHSQRMRQIDGSEHRHLILETLYNSDTATREQLGNVQHLCFGPSTKDTFADTTTTQAIGNTFEHTLPANIRFLHFHDIVESLNPEQAFCPYTFDDFAAHSVDVAERINALKARVRAKAEDKTIGKPITGFVSSQVTIDECKNLRAYIDSLVSACALAKVTLMTVHSTKFAKMHTYTQNTLVNKKHWSVWAYAKNTYDLDADDSVNAHIKSKLKTVLENIDRTMQSYATIGTTLMQLEIEAVFLLRVGTEIYKRASNGTCQRVVDKKLSTNYRPYASSDLSIEEFPTSGSSGVIFNSIPSSAVASSARTVPYGWGSIYTTGGQYRVHEALVGRGHIYADGRYNSTVKKNPENLHWCNTSSIKGCNLDFGIYKQYANYLAELETQTVAREQANTAVYQDSDDYLLGTSTRPSHGTGTAFQMWAIVNLVDNVHSGWKSIERLPTFAELMAIMGSMSSSQTSQCFDGLETRFLPDLSSNGSTIIDATNSFATWSNSNPFRSRLLMDGRNPFSAVVFKSVTRYTVDDHTVSNMKIRKDELPVVKEFAAAMTQIAWKMLLPDSLFVTNRGIKTGGLAWEYYRGLLERDDDEIAADDLFGDGSSGPGGDGDGDGYRDETFGDNGDGDGYRDETFGDNGDGDDPRNNDSGNTLGGTAIDRREFLKSVEQSRRSRTEQEQRSARVLRVARTKARLEREFQEAEQAAIVAQNRERLETNRQTLNTCPPQLAARQYRVLSTDTYGDCLYDSVAQLATLRGMVDSNGNDFQMGALRRMVADFFLTNPALSGITNQTHIALYYAIAGGIWLSLRTFRSRSETPDNSHLEFAESHSELVEVAQADDATDEGREEDLERVMHAYGTAINIVWPKTWANQPEIVVLEYLLSIRVCVYQPVDPQLPFGSLRRGLTGGRDGDPEFPVVWTNNAERSIAGEDAHYEALIIYAPLPTTGTAAIERFVPISKYSGASTCVFDAISTSMENMAHPRAKTAAELRVEFSNWLQSGVRSKSTPHTERNAWKAVVQHDGGVSALQLATKDPAFTICDSQFAGLPFAIRSNVAVYNSMNSTLAILVDAHMPFSCAHTVKILRLPANESESVRYVAA